jgi:hypothetical protein
MLRGALCHAAAEKPCLVMTEAGLRLDFSATNRCLVLTSHCWRVHPSLSCRRFVVELLVSDSTLWCPVPHVACASCPDSRTHTHLLAHLHHTPFCPAITASCCRSVSGRYHTVTCLDVMIHYPQDKADAMITHLANLADNRLIISFAPKTLAYSVLKRIGELFPGPSKVGRAGGGATEGGTGRKATLVMRWSAVVCVCVCRQTKNIPAGPGSFYMCAICVHHDSMPMGHGGLRRREGPAGCMGWLPACEC